MTKTITLTQPDDWHHHFRDGDLLAHTVPAAAHTFGRAIAMPNLEAPITTLPMALAYHERLMACVPDNTHFQPLMTLYLIDRCTPELIKEAAAQAVVVAAKLYPAGATTLSSAGVTDIQALYPVFDAMQATGLPLLLHGEVNDPDIDIFDREAVFIEQHLAPLVQHFPALKIVLEHITTQQAVDFVQSAPPEVAATITPQHLLCDRNDLLVGGIKPHYYCLPILKRHRDQQALIAAATSGNPKFFLGTDSAPHAQSQKESACGCAGCYTAPAALPLYAQCFEAHHALDRLEAFASFHGADFYGLPRNTRTITLEQREWTVPERLPFGHRFIIPFYAGRTLSWRMASGVPHE